MSATRTWLVLSGALVVGAGAVGWASGDVGPGVLDGGAQRPTQPAGQRAGRARAGPRQVRRRTRNRDELGSGDRGHPVVPAAGDTGQSAVRGPGKCGFPGVR
jgi:hypothetical protein